MIKGVYWPRDFWTMKDFNVKLDNEKCRLIVSCHLGCDGDRLIDEVNSDPKGVVFSASFDSLKKMAKIVCNEGIDMSQPLSDYLISHIVEGLAIRIYEDYLPNVKESAVYEGNGKDETFLKDYCIDKLTKDQESNIKKLNKELTDKLREIL